ncbi:hypothetical protein RN001_003320 [Aquatica leii]|uniref:Uncharacterized protein n=1 Tax=Aquatica leii TaxID=1421715 RepID=A0AAN7PI55_9COLE|nr:hypothetical protein RN001_003320 [Aquatica leii]
MCVFFDAYFFIFFIKEKKKGVEKLSEIEFSICPSAPTTYKSILSDLKVFVVLISAILGYYLITGYLRYIIESHKKI